MIVPASDYAESPPIEAIEDRIELIMDLTRRIGLLDELMTAARARRRLRQEGGLAPVASTTA